MSSPIKRLKEFLDEVASTDAEADAVIVRFRNKPSDGSRRLLFETTICLEEGKFEKFPGGYSTRLDRRPDDQGGHQLHIERGRGEKWAYRYDGSRSEPHKYTLPTTNAVRNIVSKKFGIPSSQVSECKVVGTEGKLLIVEVAFT